MFLGQWQITGVRVSRKMCVFQFLFVLHVLINFMSKQVTRCTCHLLGLLSQNTTDSVPKNSNEFSPVLETRVESGVGGFDFSCSLSLACRQLCPWHVLAWSFLSALASLESVSNSSHKDTSYIE